MDRKIDALNILEEGLSQLESKKGSTAIPVQKLSRASYILDEKEIYAWAELQLGNNKYTDILIEIFELLDDKEEKKKIVIYTKKK